MKRKAPDTTVLLEESFKKMRITGGQERTVRTRSATLPTRGQMKTLSQEAEGCLKDNGQETNVMSLFVMMMALLHSTSASCSVQASVWGVPMLGEPLYLNCTVICNNSEAGSVHWYKDGVEIFSQGELGGAWTNISDQSERDNVQFGIVKLMASSSDEGIYNCSKIQKGSPQDNVLIGKNVTVQLAPDSELTSSPNLWLQLAVDTMKKNSFCIKEGTSVQNILTQNLVGLAVSLDGYGNITQDEISQQEDEILENELTLDLEFIFHHECLCFDCEHHDLSNCPSVTRLSLPRGKRLGTGWSFFCDGKAYRALKKNYSGLCYVGRMVPLLLSKLTHQNKGHRKRRDLPPDCDDNLVLLNPADMAVAAAFVLPVPGLVVGIQKEVSKLACVFNKVTNLTAVILEEINQEMKELRTGVLQNRAAIDYLLLKNHLGCEQFEGMCCFDITDNSQKIQSQLEQLKREMAKMKTSDDWGFPNWFSWLWPFMSPILAIMGVILLAPLLLQCMSSSIQRLLAKS
ncbi:uncharacterized protein LOC125364550 [Perognathus longimembris pacificus]|uniref:uncharacterized protein LOC125364550 n=1 Tax=Perognathus longimembris pacificus TaxID=214514 RepID=UPI0020190823|nr:uncharacterized protein LOC125364550 [Perognathus longimembris pacificus]